MPHKPYIHDVSDNDALPLEYKREHRHAWRQIDVADIINNPPILRFEGTEERRLEEQFVDVVRTEGGMLR